MVEGFWRSAISTHSLCVTCVCAGIFKQFRGARNRVGIGLSYWPAWLHRLAALIPWKSILGLKGLKIRALDFQR
jgi:hypothetical protein